MKIQGVKVDDEELIEDAAINFFSRLYAKEDKERPFIDNFFSNYLDEDGVSSLE